MLSSEIRDTVLIGVAALLLSSLLGFIAFLMGVSGEFSEVRNNEIYTTQAIAQEKEFNKFKTATLYGGDVIATIRDYYNSDIAVAVKEGTTTVYEVNKTLAQATPNIVQTDYLSTRFLMGTLYKPVIVYNGTPIKDVTANMPEPDSRGYVSAIVFFKQ